MRNISLAPNRRVLSRDDALSLAQKLLGMVEKRSIGVSIEHTARAITKVANGKLFNTEDGDRVKIRFNSEYGSGLPVVVSVNQLNDVMLRRIVEQANMSGPKKTFTESGGPVDYRELEKYTFNQRAFPKVTLWHDATIEAMDTARGETLPAMVEKINSSDLVASTTIGLAARSVIYLYKHGLTAFAEETDAEVTVTARTADGKASGWSGQAARDWARISPLVVSDKAIELANRSRNSVALEPGRKMAILGPAAIAQLVQAMATSYEWASVKTGQTALSYTGSDSNGRLSKFGLRIMDPRITITSDPADQLGGFPPFFEDGSIEYNVHGYPMPAVTWIDKGILKHFAYTVPEGLDRGMPPCDIPRSVRLAPSPGTKTVSLADMIASCSEGVYVNRFSDVNLLDRKTGMMTGVTRDGCFRVKDGKIDRPLKNFRFLDSPFFSFNALEAIGEPERVAFGYNAPAGGIIWQRWPRLPVIVPPMMIRDFNFSGMAEAV